MFSTGPTGRDQKFVSPPASSALQWRQVVKRNSSEDTAYPHEVSFRAGMSNPRPTGCTQPSPALPAVAAPCPVPSWWWLCLNKRPSPRHTPITHNSHTMVCNGAPSRLKTGHGVQCSADSVMARNCMHFGTLAEHSPVKIGSRAFHRDKEV